jgi:hypothetical protein
MASCVTRFSRTARSSWKPECPVDPRVALQFLRNFHQQNAFKQAELILRAALDPPIARKAKKGELVTRFDHFDLLQMAIN